MKTKFTFSLILIYLTFLVTPFYPAYGLENTGINAANINVAAIASNTPSKVSCDSVCALLVSSGDSNGGSPKALGIDGKGGWTSASDQYCVDHGVVMPNALVTANAAAKATLASGCTVPLSASYGEQTGSAADCATANAKVLHCKLYNTQALSYCLAYNQSKNAAQNNYISVSFDSAAVATCAAACLVEQATLGTAAAWVEAACTLSDLAASAAETAATVQMGKNETAQILTYILAAGGVAAGAGVAVGTAKAIGKTGSAAQSVPKTGDYSSISSVDKNAGKTGDYSSMSSADSAGGKAGKGIGKEVGEEGARKGSKSLMKNKMACLSAAMYAALLGLRVYNILQTQSTESNSCSSLQSLISSSTTADGYTTPTVTAAAAASILKSGTAATSTIGGSLNTSGGASGGAAVGVPLYKQCSNGQSICLNTATGVAATGGGLDVQSLTKSGADQTLAPLANQMYAGGLAQQLASGATAAQVTSGALGVNASTPLGDALVKLADRVQKNPGELIELFPKGAISSSGSNGGLSQSATEADPLRPLFSFGGPNPAPSTAELAFDKKPMIGAERESDIWHSTYKGTIFQIASERLKKDVDRIEALEWETPLNRALNNLPPKKARQ